MATFDLLKSGRHQTKKIYHKVSSQSAHTMRQVGFFLRPNWLALTDQTTVSPELSHFPQDPIDDPRGSVKVNLTQLYFIGGVVFFPSIAR